MTYANFWRRSLAVIVDAAILMIIVFPVHKSQFHKSVHSAVITAILAGIASVAYFTILHAIGGQTIGKYIAQIKVVTMNGGNIGFGQSIRRSSVDILLWVLSSLSYGFLFNSLNVSGWESLPFIEQATLFRQKRPFGNVLEMITQVWFWSELVVILFNEKRRALHDYIGGTVVIRAYNVLRFP